MKKLPLSIIIITNRNDDIFERCLSSAQIAEEVLIVDHKSHNDWKKLSETYSFSIIKKIVEIKDFSHVRNEASSYARKDWILFLDSDEVLPENAHIQLARCLEQTTVAGWYIKRRDYFYDKALRFGETGSISLLRLFQKGKGHFEKPVHEICLVDGIAKKSKLVIDHYAHNSVSSFLSSVSVYSKMAALHDKEHRLSVIILKMIFYPGAKFIQNFIFRFGFRDGYRGLIYAIIMSLHSFFVRVYHYEHIKTSK